MQLCANHKAHARRFLPHKVPMVELWNSGKSSFNYLLQIKVNLKVKSGKIVTQ